MLLQEVAMHSWHYALLNKTLEGPTLDETSMNESTGNTLINPINIDQPKPDTTHQENSRKS